LKKSAKAGSIILAMASKEAPKGIDKLTDGADDTWYRHEFRTTAHVDRFR